MIKLQRQGGFADNLNLDYSAFKLVVTMCQDVESDASKCAQNAYDQVGKIYIEVVDLTQRYVTKDNDGGTGIAKGHKANEYFNTFHFNERVYLSYDASYMNSVYMAETKIVQKRDRIFGSTIGQDEYKQF